MMKNKLLIVIGIAFLVLVAILALVLINNVMSSVLQPNTTIAGCNYNDVNRSYINKDSNCVINFMCTRDRQAFRDECGCGCEVAG